MKTPCFLLPQKAAKPVPVAQVSRHHQRRHRDQSPGRAIPEPMKDLNSNDIENAMLMIGSSAVPNGAPGEGLIMAASKRFKKAIEGLDTRQELTTVEEAGS